MKRTFGIILLVLFVLFTALNSGMRLIQAITFWKVLEEYDANVFYIAISGGFWFLIAGCLVLGIWLGKRWAWAGTLVGAASYGFWYWFDRLFVQIPHANWPFSLVFTIILAGIIALILFNRNTRYFFKAQKPKHK